MKSVRELEEIVAAKQDEIETFIATAEKDDRDFSAQENEQVNAMLAELETANESLATAQKMDQQFKLIAARKLGPELDKQMGRQSDNKPVPTMMDDRGNPVYCLSKDQTIVSTLEKPTIQNGLGETLRALVCGVNNNTPDVVASALTSTSGLSGGFLVPGDLSSQVIDIARNKSAVVQAGAMTVPMETAELTMAKVISDPTIEVKAENAAFTEASITFGQVKLNSFTIGTLVTASRELAEDAPNFASLIEGVIAAALGVQLDKYAIQGTGSGEPAGLTVVGDISETGSIGAISWEDLAGAASQVRQNNHEPNAIILGVEPHEDLMVAVGGDGSSSTKTWLLRPPALEGQNLFPTNNCPLANAICGDFSMLAWGIRTNAIIEATTTGGDTFKKHQVQFKITFRGDTAVLDANAFHRLAGITS